MVVLAIHFIVLGLIPFHLHYSGLKKKILFHFLSAILKKVLLIYIFCDKVFLLNPFFKKNRYGESHAHLLVLLFML